MLNVALKFAKKHHAGQVDKAGVDYFSGHISTVVANAKKLTNLEIVLVASALHDVVEDTNVTLEEVANKFGAEVAEVVKLVTKDPNVDKAVYFKNIKDNKYATLVKLADMTHNTDLRRLKVVTNVDLERNAQYKMWMNYLNS